MKREEVGDDFSAIEWSFGVGEFDPEGLTVIWEGLEGGEEVLDELVVEADVMVPPCTEEQRKSRTPIRVVLVGKQHLDHHFFLPDLKQHYNLYTPFSSLFYQTQSLYTISAK